LTAISPAFMLEICLIGFVDDFHQKSVGLMGGISVSLWWIPFMLGLVMTPVVWWTTTPNKPPHLLWRWIFSIAAFLCSFAWLNLFADQLVGIIQTLGLIWELNEALMGLTLLAFGDAIGDWVVDILIARKSSSSMGFMSIFGSAFLNQTVGISLPVLYWSYQNWPNALSSNTQDPAFHLLQLGWGFMVSTLLLLGFALPAFRFQPPKWFGLLLIAIYVCFIITLFLLNSQI